jgi:copper(I)-binding protein
MQRNSVASRFWQAERARSIGCKAGQQPTPRLDFPGAERALKPSMTQTLLRRTNAPLPPALALASVETDAFEKVEIHEMVEIDGWPEMRELRNLPVPAGRMVRLQPGDLHLMLKKPKSHLTAGQKIDLNLTFDNGQQQTIAARVAKR